jgi:dUTP pyrophosphatase
MMKIKKVHPDSIIPQYAHEGDSGFDLYATEDVIVEPGETVKASTGLAVALPDGYELQIRPRSGVTLKTKLRVQLGTIDSTYRGEIGVIVDNISPIPSGESKTEWALSLQDEPHYCPWVPFESYIIRKGDRIAQAVLNKVEQAEIEVVDGLDETERGQKGFGSTGVSTHGN